MTLDHEVEGDNVELVFWQTNKYAMKRFLVAAPQEQQKFTYLSESHGASLLSQELNISWTRLYCQGSASYDIRNYYDSQGTTTTTTTTTNEGRNH